MVNKGRKIKRKKPKQETKKEKLKGLGGWLILPAINLVGSAILLFILIITFAFEENNLFLFPIFCISFILTSYSSVLMFQKKRRFVLFAMLTFGWTIAIDIILYALGYGIKSTRFAILIIWIWYLSVSVRVKNTFVN